MLPLFPLNLVVYPGEDLNLHIFEPRYRQLANDCLQHGHTFGMPVYLDDKVQPYGTELQITELVKRHDDGKLDIRTRGQRTFHLDQFVNPMPNKLHAGGEVTWLATTDDGDPALKSQLVAAIHELYQIMGLELRFAAHTPWLSYRVAHKIGLAQSQEYELLTLPLESQRLAFLLEHLSSSVPVVREMERAKTLIRLNGHFREFDPLKF
jgi:Lon protease-like protein